MPIKVFCLKISDNGPVDLPSSIRFSRFNGVFRGRGWFEDDGLLISSKPANIFSQEEGMVKDDIEVTGRGRIGIKRGGVNYPEKAVLVVAYGQDSSFLKVLNYDAITTWIKAGLKMTAFAAILRPDDRLIVALASGSVTYVINRGGHVTALSDV